MHLVPNLPTWLATNLYSNTDTRILFFLDTKSERERFLRPDGRLLHRLREPIRVRQGSVSVRPAYARLSQRSGQPPRVSQVFLSSNARPKLHLRKRNETRTHAALSQQAERLRLLHNGAD